MNAPLPSFGLFAEVITASRAYHDIDWKAYYATTNVTLITCLCSEGTGFTEEVGVGETGFCNLIAVSEGPLSAIVIPVVGLDGHAH